MSTDVQARVVEILAEQAMLEPSEIALDATLEDLGIDSLGLVEAVFGIEEKFDIQVPFNANDPSDTDFDISNVQSMVTAVETLVKEKA